MATEAGAIFVRVGADMSGFNRGMRGVDRTLGSVGRGFARLGKVATVATAAVAGGFLYAMKRGFDELGESQKVAAQTEAVLKSTGMAANVTARHVDELATALSRKTGIDDEQIAASENWLLSFRNIRNEMGKGNDIFDQATAATLDLARARANLTGGEIDLASASTMLGKALDNPTRGMTALTRVGVTFDEGVRKQIKTLAEHGKTLEAQKLILQEVKKNVEGSAEAFGKTGPGAVAKFWNAFDEAFGKIAKGIAPALTRALEGVTDLINRFSEARGFRAKLNIVWEGVRDTAGKALGALREAFDAIDWGQVWRSVKINTRELIDRVQVMLKETDWSRVGQVVGEGIGKTLRFAAQLAKDLTAEVVKAVLNINWTEVAKGFGQGLAQSLLGMDKRTAEILVNEFGRGNAASAIRKTMESGIADELERMRLPKKQLAAAMKELANLSQQSLLAAIQSESETELAALVAAKVQAAAAQAKGPARSAGASIGAAFGSGITSGIGAAISAATASVNAAVGTLSANIRRAQEIRSPSARWAREIGEPLGQGVAVGFVAGLRGGAAGMLAAVRELEGRIDAIRRAREDAENQAALREAKSAGDRARAKETILVTSLQRQLDIAQGAADRQQEIEERAADRRTDQLKKQLDRAVALVEAARDRVARAFDRMRDRIFRAFDAISGAFRSPAQAEIDLIRSRREQEDLAQAVADAERALAQAREAGDPVAVADAERRLARAREDIEIGSLERTAQAQLTAWEQMRENLRENLEARLTKIGEHFAKEGATWSTATEEIRAALEAFGVKFEEVGALLGKAFRSKLEEEIRAAVAAAQAAMRAIDPSAWRPGGRRADVPGPVGALPEFAHGGIVTRPTVAMIGEAGPEAVIPLPRNGGMAGGGVTLDVTVGTLVGSGGMRELAEIIRRELLLTASRNVTVRLA